ncbi:hypothetical protein TBLA_0F01500 [Henningerozyma blattae CBS 6284]|uniref:Arrestin C-terminal-like domain-containing protein n=1 Tax=Henningerozyma blattae (strain ATCC 34711 / CBS 6284 / DSM 70876 / NBRC 10599 / NRRL Y-10934 / UCD 77-7) TaxID=1071380 RepID=I2H5P1_HENB6|nr:hypothetical protein TBLA_0F01500 [Tetrapisispora blattae CBS 6284]CCH61693.1 hypothetical protein TBLA_0F01500 [Tetrapisispora blattae CBS 6284]
MNTLGLILGGSSSSSHNNNNGNNPAPALASSSNSAVSTPARRRNSATGIGSNNIANPSSYNRVGTQPRSQLLGHEEVPSPLDSPLSNHSYTINNNNTNSYIEPSSQTPRLNGIPVVNHLHSAHTTGQLPQHSFYHQHHDSIATTKFKKNFKFEETPESPNNNKYEIDPKDVSNNHDSFSKQFLSEYLLNHGFLSPDMISNADSLNISVASSGNHVYLPTISNTADEYLSSLNGMGANDESGFANNFNYNNDTDTDTNTNSNNYHAEEFVDNDTVMNFDDRTSQSTHETVSNQNTNPSSPSASGAATSCQDGAHHIKYNDSMAPFTFALILSVKKPITISDIQVELCSRVKIFWHQGVPPTKAFKEEVYKLGSLKWALNSKNFNLFIPLNVSTNDKIIENTNISNIRQTKYFKNIRREDRTYTDKVKYVKELFNSLNPNDPQFFLPGEYVFTCPIMFSNHIPETFSVPSGRVDYLICVATKSLNHQSCTGDRPLIQMSPVTSRRSSLSAMSTESDEREKIQSTSLVGKHLLHKVKNHIGGVNTDAFPASFDDISNYYAEYPVQVIRSPPNISVSTANKPVYINRVWADSLSYEISFEKKFIPLNSEIPIKIKLAPMSKSTAVKRIRVSVVEKITFVSNNLEYEYEQIDVIAKDPYNPYYTDFTSKKRKERNLSLLEVRTKTKGARAIREEIIENTINDNLLSYTTLPNPNPHSSKSFKKHKNFNDDEIPISDPWVIETVLEFPKHNDLDKKSTRYLAPYGIDLFTAIPNPESSLMSHDLNYSSNLATHKSGVINLGFLGGRRTSITSTKSLGTSSAIHSSAGTSLNNSNGSAGANGSEHPYDGTTPNCDMKYHRTKYSSSSGVQVKSHCRLSTPKRGLYLDSMNFSHIHVKHKLEVMFRIAKKDKEGDEEKTRNYEVLIDIPIILVSEFCNTGNMELPSYEMITREDEPSRRSSFIAQLPTFEEAMSVPVSPIISPIGTPNIKPTYMHGDLSIQQLSLSSNSSTACSVDDTDFQMQNNNRLRHPGGRSLSVSAGATRNIPSSSGFNTLDGVLTSQRSRPVPPPISSSMLKMPATRNTSPLQQTAVTSTQGVGIDGNTNINLSSNIFPPRKYSLPHPTSLQMPPAAQLKNPFKAVVFDSSVNSSTTPYTNSGPALSIAPDVSTYTDSAASYNSDPTTTPFATTPNSYASQIMTDGPESSANSAQGSPILGSSTLYTSGRQDSPTIEASFSYSTPVPSSPTAMASISHQSDHNPFSQSASTSLFKKNYSLQQKDNTNDSTSSISHVEGTNPTADQEPPRYNDVVSDLDGP